MRSATIYNFLIEANILAGIAIVLMMLIRKFLRGKIGNRAIWFAWLLVALRLVCPLALPNPAINEIRPARSTDLGVRPMAEQVRVRVRDAAMDIYYAVFENYSNKDRSPAAQTTWDVAYSTTNGKLSKALFFVYLGGAFSVLGYMVFQNTRFRRRLKKNRIEQLTGEMLEQYLSLAKLRKVKPVPVYLTDPLSSACLVGVFRPFIALPLSTEPTDIMKVLAHEVCHLKSRDNLWGMIRNLCCVLHWFNPLIWWAAAMSRTDCELTCDDKVVGKLDQQERLAYANMLVKASASKHARNATVIATCMSMTGRQMKQRISAIVNSHKGLRWLAFSFASLASIALLLAFATAEYTAPVYVPNPPKAVEGFADFRSITTEQDAIRYSKEFLKSVAVGTDTQKFTFKADRGDGTWFAAGFEPAKALPYSLIFDESGMITFYANHTVYLGDAYPVIGPIIDATEEGKRYFQYVTAFCDTMLPGVSSAISGMHIYLDTKNEDGRYLTIHTSNARTKLAHAFILQIEPVVRILSFEPKDEETVCFNRTGSKDAFTAYTKESAIANGRAHLTEYAGFTKQQVDSGTITASFSPEEDVWVTTFTIAADQVTGDLKNKLRSEYGLGDSFNIVLLFNYKGTLLNYKSLYAYAHRYDLIISREQAEDIGLEAVKQALGVQIPVGRVDYLPAWAEYHVAYSRDAGTVRGTVQVDAHTGETKLIINAAAEGEARYIAPKVQTSTVPMHTPGPALTPLGIDDYLNALQNKKGPWQRWSVMDKAKLRTELQDLMDAYVGADYFLGDTKQANSILEHRHSEPGEKDISQAKAESVAKETVTRNLGVGEKELENYDMQVFFYIDEPGHPIWEIQWAKQGLWIYAVQMDARDGKTMHVMDKTALGQRASDTYAPQTMPNEQTPREGDLTQEQAVEAARKAIVVTYGLDAQTVNGFTLFTAQYALEIKRDSVWASASFTPPYWTICFSLNDPRTPYDYLVILDAKTGEVLMISDPSNISNG